MTTAPRTDAPTINLKHWLSLRVHLMAGLDVMPLVVGLFACHTLHNRNDYDLGQNEAKEQANAYAGNYRKPASQSFYESPCPAILHLTQTDLKTISC